MSAPAPSWSTIHAMEQARWRRLVLAHAATDDTCAGLAAQLDAGRQLSAEQCAQLGRLAVVNGWPLPRAGSVNRGRRRR